MKSDLKKLLLICVLMITISTARANQYSRGAYYQQDEDGRIAFVSNRDGNNEIYSMNVDGSDLLRLTYNQGRDLEPDWSPDGTRIAFRSYRDSQPADIYIMDADGSNVTNITNNPISDARYPSWSPDGTRIAFSRMTDGGADIYVINSDGSGLLKVVDGEGQLYNLMPTWSPDGLEIMFTSAEEEDLPGATSAFGGFTIHKVNADGSSRQRISAGRVNTYGNLDWSWTNDKIAYYDAEVSGTAIYIMDKSISNIVKITISSDGEGQSQFHQDPSWSPDGSEIVYESRIARPRPMSDIYIVNVATGTTTNITNTPDYNDIMPDWQPIQSR